MDHGEWGDPWAAPYDDAYRALLAHVRSGPPGPMAVDPLLVAADTEVPVDQVLAAAARLEDLGLVEAEPNGAFRAAELGDDAWSDALDHHNALLGSALRVTAPRLTDEDRAEYLTVLDRAERASRLRLPELPAALDDTWSFWFHRSPNRFVGVLGVRAHERLRWGRNHPPTWSGQVVRPWLAGARAAATSGSDAAVRAALSANDALFESYRGEHGPPRPSSPVRTDEGPTPTTRRLIGAIRAGTLPVGSSHSPRALVFRFDAPPAAVHVALRRLQDLGLVTLDAGAVRIVEPSLVVWREAMELLTGLFEESAVRLLPELPEPDRSEFRQLVARAREDGAVRDHRYTDSAFAVTRFFATHSGNRWDRRALRLAIGRLVYALPEAPAFRQWDADVLWSSLDAAAGSGDDGAARTAAELFIEVTRAHVADVTARYGTMDP